GSLGVLDDLPFLWRAWRAAPSAFNLAQLLRHVGNKVVEWPVAALVYPVLGYLGWYLAYTYRWWSPRLFYVAIAAPTLSLLLTIWVGGIMTQRLIEEFRPYLPRAVDLRRRSLKEHFLGTFRCPTYWLLSPRGAGGVARAVEPGAPGSLRGRQDRPRPAGRGAAPRGIDETRFERRKRSRPGGD